jgi:hypothetical protein
MAEKHGEQIIIEVPQGEAKNVKVIETQTKGADITVRVSKERKTVSNMAVGVIVK